jgi:hypothetical protein
VGAQAWSLEPYVRATEILFCIHCSVLSSQHTARTLNVFWRNTLQCLQISRFCLTQGPVYIQELKTFGRKSTFFQKCTQKVNDINYAHSCRKNCLFTVSCVLSSVELPVTERNVIRSYRADPFVLSSKPSYSALQFSLHVTLTTLHLTNLTAELFAWDWYRWSLS